MPRLTIRYGDLTLHDDEVDELHWVDAPGQVTVTGKLVKPATAGGLMNLLAGTRRSSSGDEAKETA